jgi:hypothetical protein
VTVSSSANYLTTGLDYYAIADGPERAKYSELELYNKSKFVRRNIRNNWLICRPVHRVTLSWHASWRGVTATRSCPLASIQEIFARISSGIFLGGKMLYLCVPPDHVQWRQIADSGHMGTSLGQCTLHHMEHLHRFTARRHPLRRMPMESFSFHGHDLGSRTRLLWILKLARGCGLGWRKRQRNTDPSHG